MWSYFGGFLLVTVAGILWIGVGIAVSRCSARGWNYGIAQGLSCLGAVLICAVLLAAGRFRAEPAEFSWFGFLASCLAGVANFYTNILMAKAMRRGPNGLVWGIVESALIGPFLMSVVFFGEQPGAIQAAGLLLILGGVLAMGIAKDDRSSARGKGWLVFALGALLLAMTTQCCNTLPSYFPEMGGNDAVVRTFGLYFGGLAGFAFTSLPGMIRRRDFGGRGEWTIAVTLTVLNTSAGLFFFYRGMDLLVGIGRAGLGCPLAIGVCVIGFSLYSLLILKEKFPRTSLAGLGAACLGIILIAIRS